MQRQSANDRRRRSLALATVVRGARNPFPRLLPVRRARSGAAGTFNRGGQGLLSARTQRRPSRAEIDPAALDLIARYGAQILATARRYSLNADDAEDAYQRGLEILLTKAPTTSEEALVPWLKTVVKHEAFAIRRQRERAAPTADEGVLERSGGHAESLDEQAERLERLRLGAEALGRLKPQEVRCLLLRAEGYSYKQICELTGWTYTKVNRCLTEGRAAFLKRLDGIQSGAECERLQPLLSALADGEASAEDMAALRPHLRGCLACRAALREYRAAPRRVAALLPAPGLLAGGGGSGWLESLLGGVSERANALALKAHSAVEIASAQKVAAVAASSVVLAGGGAATVATLERPERAAPARAAATAPAEPAAPPVPAAPPPVARRPGAAAASAQRPPRRERAEREQAARGSAEHPATEFDPTGNPDTAAAPATTKPTDGGGGTTQPQPTQPADPANAEFAP